MSGAGSHEGRKENRVILKEGNKSKYFERRSRRYKDVKRKKPKLIGYIAVRELGVNLRKESASISKEKKIEQINTKPLTLEYGRKTKNRRPVKTNWGKRSRAGLSTKKSSMKRGEGLHDPGPKTDNSEVNQKKN